MFRLRQSALAAAFFGAITAVNPLGLDAYTLPKLFCLASGLALYWAARATRGGWIAVPALWAPALAVSAAALLSAAFSADRAGAWLGSSQLHAYALGPLLLYIAALFSACDADGDDAADWALALGCAVLGVSAIWQRATGVVFPGLAAATVAGNRATSLMGSPVYLGAVCAVCAPFVFQRALCARAVLRPVGVVCFLLLSAALALCGSRGAWAAFAAAAAVLVMTRRPLARRAAPALAAAAALLIGIGAWSVASRKTRTSDRGRVALWSATARMARAHPILGVGPGAFEASIGRFADAKWVAAYGRIHTQAHAHNGPLNAFATTGMLGSAAWGWLLLVLLAALARNLKQTPAPDRGANIAAASLAAVCVQAAFNPMPPVVWAVAALAAVRATGNSPRVLPRAFAGIVAVAALLTAGSIYRAAAADRAFRQAREAAHAGDARRALAGYARVSSLAPWNASARREFVRVLLAVSENAKDSGQARELADRAAAEARGAIADRPASASGYQALGASLWRVRELGGDAKIDDIRSVFSEALDRDPVRYGLLESLLKLEIAVGDPAAAARLRARLAEMDAARGSESSGK